jgi:hypothetical protein
VSVQQALDLPEASGLEQSDEVRARLNRAPRDHARVNTPDDRIRQQAANLKVAPDACGVSC